jgi:hypothetical protein
MMTQTVYVGKWLSIPEIARFYDISPDTLKTHLKENFEKGELRFYERGKRVLPPIEINKIIAKLGAWV